jgi:hypothetical protein
MQLSKESARIGRTCLVVSTVLFVHASLVIPDVHPISQPCRRLRDQVSNELHRLEAEDIIEALESSHWASNVRVVPKKMGRYVCVSI